MIPDRGFACEVPVKDELLSVTNHEVPIRICQSRRGTNCSQTRSSPTGVAIPMLTGKSRVIRTTVRRRSQRSQFGTIDGNAGHAIDVGWLMPVFAPVSARKKRKGAEKAVDAVRPILDSQKTSRASAIVRFALRSLRLNELLQTFRLRKLTTILNVQ